MKFVYFMGILAYCCSYTNLLQFCRVSHGVVKLNKIRNAVFGISKSNIVTGFCCLRRQGTFMLLILVIYKFPNTGNEIQRNRSVSRGLSCVSQKALRIHRLTDKSDQNQPPALKSTSVL